MPKRQEQNGSLTPLRVDLATGTVGASLSLFVPTPPLPEIYPPCCRSLRFASSLENRPRKRGLKMVCTPDSFFPLFYHGQFFREVWNN